MSGDYYIARALHVLGVVLWIGGVAFVTLALLPALRREPDPKRRLAVFHDFESVFARQARWTTAITGLSGLWLLWRLDAWQRFTQAQYWWMHAMVAVWAIFTLMLFVVEPLRLHALLPSRPDPAATWNRITRLHALLLGLSLITVAAAAAGSHGWAA